MNLYVLNVGKLKNSNSDEDFVIFLNEFQTDKILKLPSELFDVIHLNLLIQDLCTFDSLIHECHRLLKRGQTLIISVPDFALHEKCLTPSLFDNNRKHTFSLDLKKNKRIKSNHWNIHDDFYPYMFNKKFVLIDAYLDDHNYDYDKLVLNDQTLSGANCQIILKFKKINIQG
jgi:hypothetical protein